MEPLPVPFDRWLEENREFVQNSQGKWLAFHDTRGLLDRADRLEELTRRYSTSDPAVTYRFIPIVGESREDSNP